MGKVIDTKVVGGNHIIPNQPVVDTDIDSNAHLNTLTLTEQKNTTNSEKLKQ